MKNGFLLFPILMFLGGCCFGPVAAIVKICYEAGYSPADVIVGQYFYGFIVAIILLSVYFLIQKIRKKYTIHRLNGKTILKLLGSGICISLVTFCYFKSLQYLPAHISIVLLFQYAWIGIIIELITKRKNPGIVKIISAIIIVVATFLAAGALGRDIGDINIIGILLGIASAIFFAINLAILGSINDDKEISPIFRATIQLFFGLIVVIILMGSAPITSKIIFEEGITPYLIILALASETIPTIIFSIAAPKLSTGIATILCSSELPASIICSLIILSEEVTPIQWFGIAFMLFGIALPYIWECKKNIRKKKVC